MLFNIGFEDNPDYPLMDLEAYGVIEIDDFRESFISPLTKWTKEEYKKQWYNSIVDICRGGCAKSCLITSIQDFNVDEFVFVWVIYAEHNELIFQNKLLNVYDVYKGFDENCPCALIGERKIITEDGHNISEWIAPMSDLKDFLNRQCD